MEILSSIWEYIGRTNLFNFIIFVVVFALIFRAAKLGKKLDGAVQEIADEIKESDDVKSEAVKNLKNIEADIANLESDIDKIMRQAEANAETVGEKILSDSEFQIKSINDNAQKSLENKTILLKNDIIKRASIASIEVAKNHIINELNNNWGLHDKLIDDSIETIEGVEL